MKKKPSRSQAAAKARTTSGQLARLVRRVRALEVRLGKHGL